MQVITDVAILLYQGERRFVDDEFLLEAIAVSGLVVGIGNVRDRDALRTVLRTNPVGIGQIDADSRRGIFFATEHGGTDGIGRNPLDMRLAEARVDGRMVLEPLGILADGLSSLGGLQILVFHDALPRAFQAQRIAIHLNESVDEVYPTLVFPNPLDTVVVEHAQVASIIIINKESDNASLPFVLGHRPGLLQPIDNLSDGIAITAVGRPHILMDTLVVLDQRRVQAIGNRLFVINGGIFLLLVECFCLLLCHAVVEVAG